MTTTHIAVLAILTALAATTARCSTNECGPDDNDPCSEEPAAGMGAPCDYDWECRYGLCLPDNTPGAPKKTCQLLAKPPVLLSDAG